MENSAKRRRYLSQQQLADHGFLPIPGHVPHATNARQPLEWTAPNPGDSCRQSEAGKHLAPSEPAKRPWRAGRATNGEKPPGAEASHSPPGKLGGGRWSHDATFVGERT